MVDKNLVSEALALYSELSDPASRGLVSMMKITKLKRLLKKIEKAGQLSEVVAIKHDRIAEIREGNLIAAATHAWNKSQDKGLSVAARLKQLNYVEHHMAKAGCGWQVLQLTEKEFIELKINLMCERIERTSTYTHEARHYSDEALRFVQKQHDAEKISDEEKSKLRDLIHEAYPVAVTRIQTETLGRIAATIKSITEGDTSPEDVQKQVSAAQFELHNACIDKRDSEVLRRQLRELDQKAEIKIFTTKVDALLRDGKGMAAYDAIEKIGFELDDMRCTWADMGYDEEVIATQKLKWGYEGICDCQSEAEKLLAEGNDGAALKAMEPLRFMLDDDYASIGKNIDGALALLKKLHLFANFRYTLNEAVEPGWACGKMAEAVAALQEAGLTPANINPDWTPPVVTQMRKDLGVRGAGRELTEIMKRDSPPTRGIEDAVSKGSKLLTEIGASWDEVPGMTAIRQFVQSRGVAFPEPG